MKGQKIRRLGGLLLLTVWIGLTAFAWLRPAKAFSETERRPLEQLPELSVATMFSGKFTEKFEKYSLDQFPFRESFRQTKALFYRYALGQRDNNGIYIADGYAAKMEYPLNEKSVTHAIGTFQKIYDSYLKETGSTVFASVIPDKGYYLAEENGYLAMDYSAMFSVVQQEMPWATYIDITDCLEIDDYYYTDTHWRQEQLLPVAQRLSQTMGLSLPQVDDFSVMAVEQPFYGVYYGQAALPMEPDNMFLMESNWLKDCRVYNYEKDSYGSVYDLEQLTGNDLYEVYLSGAQSLLTIENPNATTDRELILFRDSFGSSLAPLLTMDYAKITLVDVRYIPAQRLGNYLDFHGQDVLFLYSTLVLNSNAI